MENILVLLLAERRWEYCVITRRVAHLKLVIIMKLLNHSSHSINYVSEAIVYTLNFLNDAIHSVILGDGSVEQYNVMMQYRYCLSKYCNIAIYCRERKSPKQRKELIVGYNILGFLLVVLAV